MFFDLSWRKDKPARNSRGQRHSVRRGRQRTRTFSLESLEDRRVLSVGPFALLSAGMGSLHAASSIVGKATVTPVVTPVDTTTALTPTTASTTYGQPVTLTATVTPFPGAATFRHDTVEFLDNLPDGSTKLIARAWVSPQGVATAVVSTLPVAGSPHSITAKFDGDPSLNSSTSTAATVTVDQAASTTTVYGCPNPSAVGQSVTFVAVVTLTGQSGVTPMPLTAAPMWIGGGGIGGWMSGRPSGGKVDFFIDNAATPIVVQANGWGVATYSINSLTAGQHTVVAVYEGDSNFIASQKSSPVTQQVVSALTSTRLTAVPKRFSSDGVVTLTATVKVRGGASVSTPLSGTVEFLDGSTSLGLAVTIDSTMLDSTGTIATVTFSTTLDKPLGPGLHFLSAKYSGAGADYGASAGFTTEWVGPIPWATGPWGGMGMKARDHALAGWPAMPGLAMGGRW